MDFLPFPRLKFADENCLTDQFKKMASERKESEIAFESEPIERVAEELVDKMVAVYTALCIIERQFGIHPLDVILRVHEKNRLRGYEL
jgi:hypothetical protein